MGEKAKIPHEEFLAGIRNGDYEVDDLFDSPNTERSGAWFGMI